jgi:hypothetical protein
LVDLVGEVDAMGATRRSLEQVGELLAGRIS